MKKTDKIALVIEGGGFRSVFTAGVLDAFLINHFNPFHIYIGVSSGAMALSYYIFNQYKSYFELSKEVCVNDEFLSYTHVLSEQGYMDLKFLTKYAKENNPLKLERIKELIDNKKFYIVATSLDNGEAIYLEPNKKNIYRCLRATSSLPFFTKGSCKIDGVNLMDGAWSDPIPAKSASDFGANRIIVVRPNPIEHRISGLSYLSLLSGYWWKNNPRVQKNFFEEDINYNRSIDFLNKDHKTIEIIQIYPDNILKSRVIGTNKEDLTHDYHCGLEKGLDFLDTKY